MTAMQIGTWRRVTRVVPAVETKRVVVTGVNGAGRGRGDAGRRRPDHRAAGHQVTTKG